VGDADWPRAAESRHRILNRQQRRYPDMQLYDIQAYSEAVQQERLASAAEARRAKFAATTASPLNDPYTLRWTWNRIANWRPGGIPGHIRKGGYGEMFPGSFR
jgi:hypothetical protein